MSSKVLTGLLAVGWRRNAAAAVIIAIFLFGGGARADISSLILLRPLMAVTLVILMFVLGRRVFDEAPGPFILLLLAVLLVLAHLVPLPPAVWTALPGRSAVTETMDAVGVVPGWMPFTLSPVDGWNQLFALMIPAGAMYVAVGMGRESSPFLLKLLLMVILASALLGLLQAIGPAQGPLYLYRITNNGLAVGLFSNRNHQAMLLACAFPLLALWASTARGSAEALRAKYIVALCAALALVPLLLVTGSRSGLGLAVLGIVAGLLLFRRSTANFSDRRKGSGGLVVLVLAAGAICLAALAAAFSGRGTAWQRLTEGDAVEDLRFQALPYISEAIWAHFPFGSGAGSFVPVYKLIEPERLISADYFNHAHNDVAEILLEFGLPGLLLMLLGVLGWAWSVQRLWRLHQASDSAMRTDHMFGWAGAAILFILGLGSLVDYPLRTPSLAALVTIAAVWMAWAAKADRPAGLCSSGGIGSSRQEQSAYVEL